MVTSLPTKAYQDQMDINWRDVQRRTVADKADRVC